MDTLVQDACSLISLADRPICLAFEVEAEFMPDFFITSFNHLATEQAAIGWCGFTKLIRSQDLSIVTLISLHERVRETYSLIQEATQRLRYVSKESNVRIGIVDPSLQDLVRLGSSKDIEEP